jgi:hypothetical protein
MTNAHSKIDLRYDSFRQREIGLEEAFFKERDRQLLQKLRGELSAMEERRKLEHVSGIVEEHVLTSLVEAGVRAETLAAVSFIPMIEVAWCDGSIAPDERDAVLNTASVQGIDPSSAAFEILKHWLDERPDPRIIEAWKEYVKEMSRIMPKEGLAAMKTLMLDRCARVAGAAGGFLGLETISKHERSKIDEFAKAWDG